MAASYQILKERPLGQRHHYMPSPFNNTKTKGKILWLLGPSNANGRRIEYIRKSFPAEVANKIHFIEMNKTRKFWVHKPKTKGTFTLTADYADIIQEQIAAYLYQTSCIVVNDFSVLAAILHQFDGHGTKKKLLFFRGSIYYSQLFRDIPAIVVDDVMHLYNRDWSKSLGGPMAKKANRYEAWQFDVKKICRFWAGEEQKFRRFEVTYKEPPLDKKDISSYLGEAREFAKSASHMAIDFETTIGYISCTGFTAIQNGDLETLRTYLVPYLAPWGEYHYKSIVNYGMLKTICEHSNAEKFFANGSYDTAYALRYGVATTNYNFDLIHGWHSYRPQSAKALWYISSLLNDTHYYWKDEGKGHSPTTWEGFLKYWRYCARDSYETFIGSVNLLPLIAEKPHNYIREFAMQMGPLMETNFTGCYADVKRLDEHVEQALKDEQAALEQLEIASAGWIKAGQATDRDIATWIYDVLGAREAKQGAGKSVDRKVLQLVGEESPLFHKAVALIADYKKPKKRKEMYSKFSFDTKAGYPRVGYKFSAAGTYTGRLASSSSDFWVGGNMQNIPAKMRDFITADPGYIFVDCDYSQSDLYFVAFESGDEVMIGVVTDDRDTHSFHVELILKVPYDEVVKGKSEGADWVVNPITGVRQIIKKVTHGGNYGMSPPTAYVNIGREALVAAAKTLDISVKGWQRRQYYNFVAELIKPYFEHYKGLHSFGDRLYEELQKNKGYLRCYSGWEVYFPNWANAEDKSKLKRDLQAFKGQGGTAGMVNTAMLNAYYKESWYRETGTSIKLQVHDSIVWQTPVENLLFNGRNYINHILRNMEIPIMIYNRNFKVPVEVNVGPAWSKSMPEIKPQDSDEDIARKIVKSYSKRHIERLL